jgi:tetratricopeptide (TPR) repeat protein
LLLMLLVDEDVDKEVDQDAKDEFAKGEKYFQEEDFENAVKYYYKALKVDSNYYKATLYVGDAFYRDKEYEKALVWYGKAVKMHPEMLEGHKYLTDVYMKLKRWQEAYDACVDGIATFPDVGMFYKLQKIADEMDKKFDRKWFPRYYMPISDMETDATMIAGDENNEYWNEYRKAFNEVRSNASKKGVLDNVEGNNKYIEIYSWDKMLTRLKSVPSDLSDAKTMQQQGFLDCYVMVSMYHVNFREQYKDFSKNNRDRIKEYIRTYLVK